MNVAIIPARGGSRGIPRKNLALLNNRPLISYTIFAARESSLDAVYVSTEDPEIAKVSQELGAQIIWRPTELASDTTSSEDVLVHAIRELGNQDKSIQNVAFIQATSPFLKQTAIDEAIDKLKKPKYDSVITVCPEYGYFGEITDDEYQPMRTTRQRRQDMTPFYRDNGALYYLPAEIVLKRKRYGDHIGTVMMTYEESVEVDSHVDLQICEILISSGVL